MGGGSPPQPPPAGGLRPPLDHPLFFFKTQNALSPLSALLNLLEGSFKSFFEILHDDMGGGLRPPPTPPAGGTAPPIDPPAFFLNNQKRTKSPFLPFFKHSLIDFFEPSLTLSSKLLLKSFLKYPFEG